MTGSTISPGSAYVQQCPSCVVDGAYFRAGGTSMSAPVVAGVVALVLQAHPDWTPDQVKWALVNSSRLLKSHFGEVNASAVLASADLYQKVKDEQDRSSAILANIADGIVAVDRDGRVVSAQQAADRGQDGARN